MHSDPEIDQILAEQQRQRNRQRLRRLGLVAVLIVAIIVLAFVSEPYLRSTRNEGREASAIGSEKGSLNFSHASTSSIGTLSQSMKTPGPLKVYCPSMP